MTAPTKPPISFADALSKKKPINWADTAIKLSHQLGDCRVVPLSVNSNDELRPRFKFGGPCPNNVAANKWASNDPEIIKEWCSAGYPAYGLIADDKFLGLDIDCKSDKPGLAFLEVIRKAIPDIDKGLVVNTPSGGIHYYMSLKDPKGFGVHTNVRFQFDDAALQAEWDELETVFQGVNDKGKPIPVTGIDIRYGNGYLVGPNSLKNGDFYTLANEGPLVEMTLKLKVADKNANNGRRNWDNMSLDRITELLGYIKLYDSGYKVWCDVGMAIHNEQSSAHGLKLWTDWSSQGSSYKEGECEAKWKSFDGGHGFTGGTLVFLAKEGGYIQPNVKDLLLLNDKGKVINSTHNMIVLIENHWKLKDTIAYDTFVKAITYKGEILTDRHISEIRDIVAIGYFSAFKVNSKDIYAAICSVGYTKAYDSLQDYCNGLIWDGVERLDRFCSDYLGVQVCETMTEAYISAVGKYFFCSAIIRAMIPGSQVDSMVIINSDVQGLKKTTLYRELFGDRYKEVSTELKNKDFMVNMNGAWLYYHGEMAALSKSEAADCKRLLTCREDTYRAPYGITTETHKRRCIWAGDTNENQYLQDTTGNRRFLPIAVTGMINIDRIVVERDQFFAEAMHLFNTHTMGEWWEISDAETVQEQARMEDPWEDAWLESSYVKGQDIVTPDKFTTQWALSCVIGIKPEHQNKGHSLRLGKTLRKLGYNYKLVRKGKDVDRKWVLKQ